MSQNLNKYLMVIDFYRLIFTFAVCICLFFISPAIKLELLPSFTDEIILFLILCYACFKFNSDRVVKGALVQYFILFVVLFVLSINSLNTRGFFAVTLQIFIHLKFVLLFIFCWSFLGPRNCLQLVLLIMGVTVCFLILNLLTGSLFNDILNTKITLRSGGARPIGIQADTGSLGTTIAFIGSLIVTKIKNNAPGLKLFILLLLSILLLLASTRTALILIPLVISWWFRDSIKSFAIALLFLISSVLFIQSSSYVDELIDITIENIEWTIDDPVASSYIRGIMIYFAVDIAIDRFPLGAGAATYGTVMSDNSPVYSEIGLQNSRYFIEKDGIYDSNFASLLGEFGFIGFFLFLWLMKKVAFLPSQVTGYHSSNEFKYIVVLLTVAYILTTPIFMNTYPAFILSLVVVASHCEKSSCK